jgi:hypothetical protein
MSAYHASARVTRPPRPLTVTEIGDKLAALHDAIAAAAAPAPAGHPRRIVPRDLLKLLSHLTSRN